MTFAVKQGTVTRLIHEIVFRRLRGLLGQDVLGRLNIGLRQVLKCVTIAGKLWPKWPKNSTNERNACFICRAQRAAELLPATIPVATLPISTRSAHPNNSAPPHLKKSLLITYDSFSHPNVNHITKRTRILSPNNFDPWPMIRENSRHRPTGQPVADASGSWTKESVCDVFYQA